MICSKNVNILGTNYEIQFDNYKDNTYFEDEKCDGYCDNNIKKIVICNMSTFPNWDNESPEYYEKVEKKILKHEIIHAFLYESGLSSSSFEYKNGWALNEEMIDFFAIQFSKIAKVFEQLNIL